MKYRVLTPVEAVQAWSDGKPMLFRPKLGFADAIWSPLNKSSGGYGDFYFTECEYAVPVEPKCIPYTHETIIPLLPFMVRSKSSHRLTFLVCGTGENDTDARVGNGILTFSELLNSWEHLKDGSPCGTEATK